MHIYDDNILITYNSINQTFHYPSCDSAFWSENEMRPLWQIFTEDNITSERIAQQFHNKIKELSASDTTQVYFAEYFLKKPKQKRGHWYRVGFLRPVPGQEIHVTFTDIDEEVAANCRLAQMTEYDTLTGLLNHSAFCKNVTFILNNNKTGIAAGEYAIVYLDVLHFKAINDMFGISEGDRLLQYIADTIRKNAKNDDVVCRQGSDRFILFTHTSGPALEKRIHTILDAITRFDLAFEITCNAGIYITNNETLPVDSMIDRAILAHASIKGNYTQKYGYFAESLRNDMLSEQEISGMMALALTEKQFVIHYQPQYNHTNGVIVGAEALVRWNHPEQGLISPGTFIPLFEKNGFITKLDLYVFEEVCRFIRKCMDKKIQLIPISANFSRHDIFQANFVEKLEGIRQKYNVPASHLRIEITESAIMGDNRQKANEILKDLRQHGYVIEMDDFGSGYSSLNILKDIELDILKLDMLFLSEQTDNNARGGTILSAVIRMAKWLGMPIIAEGVEDIRQADFLRSIGCEYMQGFLYSKPLPEEQFESLLSDSSIGAKIPQLSLIETLNAANFWNPNSQETLIFNHYVGGAAIFSFYHNQIEILRVNQKYTQELGMNLSEREIIQTNLLTTLDAENRAIYVNMLTRAIETADEQECDTWRTIVSSCGEKEKMCIRSTVRMIGQSNDTYLFYSMIRNITTEMYQSAELRENEKRFKIASEQVGLYYWEYTIATKEMRPCFRCMRDLGLPPLLTNYPESIIERGIFPPEAADMYRDWHKQIADGASSLEAVIPLTEKRIPFRVKYTTEFDENGHPIKAYGSAALIQ